MHARVPLALSLSVCVCVQKYYNPLTVLIHRKNTHTVCNFWMASVFYIFWLSSVCLSMWPFLSWWVYVYSHLLTWASSSSEQIALTDFNICFELCLICTHFLFILCFQHTNCLIQITCTRKLQEKHQFTAKKKNTILLTYTKRRNNIIIKLKETCMYSIWDACVLQRTHWLLFVILEILIKPVDILG